MDRRWRGDEVVIFFSIEIRASFEVEKNKRNPYFARFLRHHIQRKIAHTYLFI
jgi:ribosomal protein L31E